MRLFEPAKPWEYRWRIALLFLSQPALAAVHHWSTGGTRLWYSPQFDPSYAVVATLLAACGLAIRVWGTSYLTAAVVTGLTARNDRLVVGGPFGVIRNPLYVGTLLIFAGFGMFFGPWFAAAFVLFHWFRYGRVIRFEEEFLRAEWGREFQEYCGAVPRWWPEHVRRSDFVGPFATIDGILGNGVFLGMFVGFAVSAWHGTLEPLVHCEALGWGLSGLGLLQSKLAAARPAADGVDLSVSLPITVEENPAGQSRRAG